MPEFAPMRTGQLVVRYHSRWRKRRVAIGAAVIAALLLYGVYEWGRSSAGYSKLAEIQRDAALAAQIEALKQENERLRADVAAAQLARDVERKAYADVEKNLADLQAQVLRHREELTFYRGIVSPQDGIGGLRIQNFRILPSGAEQHFSLKLVLVQSMRQDAMVTGAVTIQIEGVQENRPVVLSLAEAGGKTRADGQVPFQLRYFQNLEQDIVLPVGFEPRAVNVEVRSGRLDPVRESFPWQVKAEG